MRFFRQPARVAAAIGTPLLLWLFMGAGFAGDFRPAGLHEQSYAAFLLPGAMTLVAVFASIFSSISIIEDRNEGWLQAALVAPAPRWSLALGRILGSSITALAQAAILLLALPFVDARISAAGIALSLLALAVTTFGMTAMGLVFAWRSETTASFHAVMNIVFMPMWLLSGAFFPPAVNGGQSTALGWLMTVNPLTWCTQAIRLPLAHESAWGWLWQAAAFALAMFVLAVRTVSRSKRV